MIFSEGAEPRAEPRDRPLLQIGGPGPEPSPPSDDPKRRLVLIIGAVLGVGLSVIVAIWVGRSATGWLENRDTYRLDFREIELDPAPPEFLRLDARALLDRVRERANWPESLSMLGTDKAALASAFSLQSPWVEEVREIESRYPNRMIARLRYRRPVARLTEPDVEARRVVVVDRLGYRLPIADLDPEFVKRLPLIGGVAGQSETRDGRRIAFPDPIDVSKALAGAALAGFFADRAAEENESPPPSITLIDVSQGPEKLYALVEVDGDGRPNRDRDLILNWGAAIGMEPTVEPSSAEKWRQFLDWWKTRRSDGSHRGPPA